MKCPKCEEGRLIKIKFRTSGKNARLCEFCDALWFDNEITKSTTGYTIQMYYNGKENEFDKLNEQGQDHRAMEPVRHL